jgi:malate dehydrogenase (oxaloacetate-decarboxylating)(NADP+)
MQETNPDTIFMTTRPADEMARKAALDYHALPKPGKLEIRPTKPLANPQDLTKAYSPGVAEACLAIKDDPLNAARYTARGNLVAVVSNGSATLGLGDIGALASKPVMEGKAVLFKKFANIDCFDIELNESDPEKLAEHVIALEPTFGAINLEDIKAPDCFIVEEICRKRMGIPVFHDDQHGTAIVVGAAALNAVHLTGRSFAKLKIVSTGGGAAGIACLDMLVTLGVKAENIWLYDKVGLVHRGRMEEMTPQKDRYAQAKSGVSLADAFKDADLFLGLSGPNIIKPEWIKLMGKKPIVLALANPVPEIMPDEVRKAAPDAIIATGRSDYPNQVNNVLCFPFIFRGALDAGATEINETMKAACVEAIASLARRTTAAEAAAAYGNEDLKFGPDYLIPKPFDPRLLSVVAPAVAKAAMESGVATRPIPDLDRYRDTLNASVYRSALVMRPVFEAAREAGRRIAFAEGEDERVLRAAVALLEDTNDKPILIGRPEVIASRCERHGLPKDIVSRFEIVNPESDVRYRDYWETYHKILERRGVTPDIARGTLRTNTTAIAAVMVHRGEADSLICGTIGQYHWHLKYIARVLGTAKQRPLGALSLMILDGGPIFIADTQLHPAPTPEQIAAITVAAARHTRRFGIAPQVALCSNSQFGNLESEGADRMRRALAILEARECDFAYEGEMQVDTALDPELRRRIFPNSRLEGRANVLVFGASETASAVRNSLKTLAGGIEVGPILMGMGNRAHIATPSITVRGLINLAALAAMPVKRYG